MITRESWLRSAVSLINERFFGKEINLEQHPYQIACGWTKRPTVVLGETLTPKPESDQTFPMTIHINVTIDDPIEILGVLVHEFIHGFYNIHGHGKDFGKLAKKVGFVRPYTQYHPSDDMVLRLRDLYNEMVIHFGEWPGKAITTSPKEKKDGPKNTYVLFCPSCGYEVRVSRKMFEKYGQKLPTCVCGAKMARDCEDEQDSKD